VLARLLVLAGIDELHADELLGVLSNVACPPVATTTLQPGTGNPKGTGRHTSRVGNRIKSKGRSEWYNYLDMLFS
jgi:hypothetical protein